MRPRPRLLGLNVIVDTLGSVHRSLERLATCALPLVSSASLFRDVSRITVAPSPSLQPVPTEQAFQPVGKWAGRQLFP
ncbi:hypothetical protein BaRGS_00026454 [Batillaria attramentaria]|uniref:Uncharacterized protein n=1 Tax=Batillaria attramentaria TaxID=370345 RepID=A0ABD0K673_9CAEN